MTNYNPPLRVSTLRMAKYSVPADVLDNYVAGRVRDMSEEILKSRRKVSYVSVNDWADHLERHWTSLIEEEE